MTRPAPQRTPERLPGDDAQPSQPGPGEILISVQACGRNDVERALGSGAVSQLSAAGTVVAAGEDVTRFAVGDEVFGHFLAGSWTQVEGPCVTTAAEGPHVERRPDGLDPLAAAALAESGVVAKTILRAAELRSGQTALVIGATSRAGTLLVPLLAEAGAHVIAATTPDEAGYVRSLGAADTIEYTSAHPLALGLASHPDVDLLVDLVGFGEPYFITAAADDGTIVTAVPVANQPGIPRIVMSAEPGDLAALAQHALTRRQPAEIAHVYQFEEVGQAGPADTYPAAQPAVALGG
jgi:NADPH:quinone reductase